jgi:hypothetical protein
MSSIKMKTMFGLTPDRVNAANAEGIQANSAHKAKRSIVRDLAEQGEQR